MWLRWVQSLIASATMCDRLNRRMRAQVVHAAGAKCVGAGVFPDIGARAAVAAELDGVEVRGAPDTKHANEFVLAPVKAALAGVGFHPGNEIEHGAIDGAAGGDQFADVAPIHADKMHGAVDRSAAPPALSVSVRKLVKAACDISPEAMANSWCLTWPRPPMSRTRTL